MTQQLGVQTCIVCQTLLRRLGMDVPVAEEETVDEVVLEEVGRVIDFKIEIKWKSDALPDMVLARCTSLLTDEFCKTSNLQQGVSFSLSRYTESEAMVLARTWAQKKMQLRFQIWLANDCRPLYRFSNPQFDEPEAFAQLANRATGALTARVQQSRDMVPL